MTMASSALVLLFCLTFLASPVLSEEKKKYKHKFEEGEVIPFYVSKIGPYANTQQGYEYYKLPFCSPGGKSKDKASVAETLAGHQRRKSLYEIKFNVNEEWKELCPVKLEKKDIIAFQKAIKEFYYFEFFFDDLPLRGFIGTYETTGGVTNYYLFQHMHFEIEYNENRIVYASTASNLNQMTLLDDSLPTQDILFTYSVHWKSSRRHFSKRMEYMKENQVFTEPQMEIHWLAIINSLLLVILLTGFIVLIITRVLKSDYSRYSKSEDSEDGSEPEDYGWKLVHGDVFRFPPYKSIFCAFIGIGSQALAIGSCIFSLALFGYFYPGDPGHIYTAVIFIYAPTAVLGGYISASFYKQFGGESWAWNIILTATLYAVPFLTCTWLLNFVALKYRTTSYIPVKTFFLLLSVWIFVGIPFTIFGGIAGRRSAGPFSAPTRTKNFPREIPSVSLIKSGPMQMLMAGFLPFSAIYVELYYIFASVWGHESYTLYGILFLVFIILLVVTACITIALTYFQLSMEDYRWWWRSFFNGGSTAIFVLCYSFFFYTYRSHMTGLLQTSFFFGEMFLFCYFFFIMLGTVGFFSSLFFIRRIYKKVD